MCVIYINPERVSERMSARVCCSPAGPVSLPSELLLDSADNCFATTDLSSLEKDRGKCVYIRTSNTLYGIYIYIYIMYLGVTKITLSRS